VRVALRPLTLVLQLGVVALAGVAARRALVSPDPFGWLIFVLVASVLIVLILARRLSRTRPGTDTFLAVGPDGVVVRNAGEAPEQFAWERIGKASSGNSF
jgi:hypothetical protein